jgi:hypothetical protein
MTGTVGCHAMPHAWLVLCKALRMSSQTSCAVHASPCVVFKQATNWMVSCSNKQPTGWLLMYHVLCCCCAAVFFTYTAMGPTQGFFWMGVMVIGMTALYMTVYFPMWGGMFCAAKPGVTEEDYYISGGYLVHSLYRLSQSNTGSNSCVSVCARSTVLCRSVLLVQHCSTVPLPAPPP